MKKPKLLERLLLAELKSKCVCRGEQAFLGGLMSHAFSSSTQVDRQEELYEFEASLLQLGLYSETLSENTTTTTKVGRVEGGSWYCS